MKLIALFIASACFNPVDLETTLGLDMQTAALQLEGDSKTISTVCAQYNIDADEVKSIVFPEYIRNNTLQGMLEIKALEIMYVDIGSDKVDFSIGQFQIKPSFVNRLESIIEKNASLKTKYTLLRNTGTTEKAKRKLRVDRLKETEWQVRYVCCFVDYCQIAYAPLEASAAGRIQFLATAYNTGLKEKKQDIEKNYSLEAFPYGSKFDIPQLSYWKVSLEYFIKHAKSLVHAGKHV